MLVHDVVVSTSCVQGFQGFVFLWMGGWWGRGGVQGVFRIHFLQYVFPRFCFLGRLFLCGVWVVEDTQEKRKAKAKKQKNKRKTEGKRGKSIMMNRKKKRRKMSKRTSRDSRAGLEREKGPNTFTEWNGHFDRGEKATSLETKQQAARNLFGRLRLRRQRRRSASHGARLPSQVWP